MLRTAFLIFLFISSSVLTAQDVVVFSKYSESALKNLEKLANSTSEKELLELHKVKSIKTLNAAVEKFANASFSVDKNLPMTCKSLVEKALKEFSEKVKSLSKAEQIKQTPLLKVEFEKALTKELNNLEKISLKPIFDATSELEKERAHNQSLYDALSTSEIESIDHIIAKILKEWKKSNDSAVLTTEGNFIADIKSAALKKAEEDAETTFPFPNPKALEQEALKKFRLYKVGDKITLKHSPRPTQTLSASGQIRSLDAQKVKIGFNSINIKDITDPVLRDGLSKVKTLANRKKFIDEKILDIKKKRLKHFDENLQPVADTLIQANEKKGFVLYIGNWTPVAKVATAYINTKAKQWKQTNVDLLEKASLADAKLIDEINSNTSNFRNFFSKSIQTGQKELTAIAQQLVSEAELADDDVELTEEELNRLEQEEAEKKKKIKEEAAKAASEQRKQNLAKKRKIEELAKQKKEQEEAAQSSMVMIGAALVVVCLVGFLAFNGKVRNKLFGKKKKSMHDVVSNLQGGPQNNSPNAPLPAPDAGGPAGSMAPKPIQNQSANSEPVEKTKIELDDGLSIERGGNDEPAAAPAAAPRKKISLNLGGSTTSLENNNIDESEGKVSGGATPPPAAGGLTPPGGGLTPPGGGSSPAGGGLTPPGGGLTPPGGELKAPGGLTPPGGGLTPPGGGLKPPGSSESNDDSSSSENSDKSNLIMNPNLDSSGDKLRLKK